MKNEAKLTFEFLDQNDSEFQNREASKIQFTVPDDMTIWEFKTMCVRLASAIGYTTKSIKTAFGDTHNEEEGMSLEEIKLKLFPKKDNNEIKN